MVERLTDIQVATLALMDLPEVERIGVCRAVLTALRDPFVAPALMDAGHVAARHADALARSPLDGGSSAGADGGLCRSGRAAFAPRPVYPGGAGAPSGAFPADREGALRDV